MADEEAVELKDVQTAMSSDNIHHDAVEHAQTFHHPLDAGALDSKEELEAFTWDAVFVFKVGDENIKEIQKFQRPREEKDDTDDTKPKGRSRTGSVIDRREVNQKELFTNTTADVVARLSKAGFKTDLYFSCQKDEVYLRVGMTEQRLMIEAERTKYDLQLDEEQCISAGKRMGIELAKKVDTDGDINTQSELPKEIWQNIYGRYDQPNKISDEERGTAKDDHWRQKLYYRYPSHTRMQELKEASEAAKAFRDPANPEEETEEETVLKQELAGLRWEAKQRPRTLFTSTDRLKLMMAAIEARSALGGADISLPELLEDEKHSLIAFYPLHENHKKEVLMKKWYHLKSTFDGPLNDIRSYFGEQVGLYFAFLQFYNRQLVLPALVGILVFVWQLVADRIDIDVIPAYAIFIALWATIFLELWKRKEAGYRVRWGQVSFAEKEQPRPEFIRNAQANNWNRPSRVDGHDEAHMPWITKVFRVMMSQAVIWFLIALVLAALLGVILFRLYLVDSGQDSLASILPAILNAIQIQILNQVYQRVAGFFNEFENHRTDSDYQNALIAKNFLFKFINSYNSFFYIAFYKKHDSSLDDPNDPTRTRCLYDGDCLKELRDQLGIIFLSLLVINNTIEVVLPYIMGKLAERENRVRASTADEAAGIEAKPMSQPEKEFNLAPYESTFDDFDELIVQFGFCVLFVVAFPIAPTMALLNNVIETRVDAEKLCRLSRRPEPRGAYDIGTWSDIINILSFVAVMTNAALIVFETKRFVPGGPDSLVDTTGEQYVTFIIAEHLVILIKFSIAYFVPDESEELVEHRERQTYIVNVLINGLDEDGPSVKVDDISGVPALHEFDWSRVADDLQYDGKEHH